MRGAALLEARKVVEGDARELHNLLPAQAGHASHAARWKPDLRGVHTVAPGAKTAAKLILHLGHVSMMPYRARARVAL